ncbi:MAG: lactate racemase domain-containing protein [Phycisphaerae bacterium]|nr:lactate racemase domain-containing protein [Phycisphaerae bacterium]
MPEVSLPWGPDGPLKVPLPDHWTLQQVAQASLPLAGDDWPDRLGQALAQPTGELPLGQLLAARRTGRIVLVVEDFSRHSPLEEILAVVMAELTRQCVSHEQVEIVFATGMHPPMSAEQARAKLGALAQMIRWRSNRCKERSRYVYLGQVRAVDLWVDRGVAEADLRIVISQVSPHLQAGFGGGYKMFVPGCGALETIRQLHRLGVGRRPRPWVGTEAGRNPMRMVIDAGGERVDQMGKSFALQYVLDDADRPTFIVAGQMLAAQQMLAKRCAVACGVMVERTADVLVVNAYPRDCDLWQSFKGIANTRWAAREGGVILCFARCQDGMHGMDVPRWPLLGWRTTRRLVRLLGSETLSGLFTRLAPNLAGDAAFFVRLALQAIHRNTIFMVSPALAATGRSFPGLRIFADPAEAIRQAGRILGDSPQRVVVFPTGGTTYPVLTGGAGGQGA